MAELKTTKASVIQVSDNGWNDYTVDIIYAEENDIGDDNIDADSHFEGEGARAKAEKRARELSKLLGCSWESNY